MTKEDKFNEILKTHGMDKAKFSFSEWFSVFDYLTFIVSKMQCNIPVVMPMLADINFREMRKAKGLTLKNVEEKTGLSNAYLSQLENGKVKSPGYLVVKQLYELYAN
jgi:hypothetical protein